MSAENRIRISDIPCKHPKLLDYIDYFNNILHNNRYVGTITHFSSNV